MSACYKVRQQRPSKSLHFLGGLLFSSKEKRVFNWSGSLSCSSACIITGAPKQEDQLVTSRLLDYCLPCLLIFYVVFLLICQIHISWCAVEKKSQVIIHHVFALCWIIKEDFRVFFSDCQLAFIAKCESLVHFQTSIMHQMSISSIIESLETENSYWLWF